MRIHFATGAVTACGRPASSVSATAETSRVSCITCRRSYRFAAAVFEAEHGRIDRSEDIRYYDDDSMAALRLDDPAQVSLDIYATDGDSAMPVVVYIHGGSFRYGDKRDVSAMPVFYLGSGYVFVSINHRLIGPATGMLDIPHDTAAALAWVHWNIGDFGGDASNVFVVGSSSGGHQAALVALRHDLLADHGLAPAEVIRAVVVLDCGSLDMPLRVGPTLHEMPDADAAAMLDECKRISPVHQVVGSPFPDFLLFWTDHERREHAERMAARLLAAGGSAATVSVQDVGHTSLGRKLHAAGNPYGEMLLDFLRDRIRPGGN